LQIEEAKAVCRRCPVIDACLSFALEFGHDAGVWGALTDHEPGEFTDCDAGSSRGG
jgi:WhiB family redox-sensing transcriptional regulator